jgi:hypothetical protein
MRFHESMGTDQCEFNEAVCANRIWFREWHRPTAGSQYQRLVAIVVLRLHWQGLTWRQQYLNESTLGVLRYFSRTLNPKYLNLSPR